MKFALTVNLIINLDAIILKQYIFKNLWNDNLFQRIDSCDISKTLPVEYTENYKAPSWSFNADIFSSDQFSTNQHVDN